MLEVFHSIESYREKRRDIKIEGRRERVRLQEKEHIIENYLELDAGGCH